MTAAEAMIDAAVTIRVWQRERLSAAAIARQLGCGADWDMIETYIVVDLLTRGRRSSEPMQRAA